MKYCLFLIVILYGNLLCRVNSACKCDEPDIRSFNQQSPFYFLSSVPAKVKLFDKIDLSFFRNRLIVSMYRYRIDIPSYSEETEIDSHLLIWSPWIKDDFTGIRIPMLDHEGGYRLIVEYKTMAGNETNRFEKLFYVYRAGPSEYDRNIGNNAGNIAAKAPAKKTSADIKLKPVPLHDSTKNRTKNEIKRTLIAGNSVIEKMKVDNLKPDSGYKKATGLIIPETHPFIRSINANQGKENLTVLINREQNFSSLLTETVKKMVNVLIKKPVVTDYLTKSQTDEKGYLARLPDKYTSGNTLFLLTGQKESLIKETSNTGNSPLHDAIISGKNDDCKSLIDQGADLNAKNNLGLSPLHLAVFLNNMEITKELIRKGANINLKGNTGYTPLHIASEMNYPEMTISLLNNGALKRIKTDQGLSSITIAKIQNNDDVLKLLRTKNLNPGSFTSNYSHDTAASDYTSDRKQYSFVDFYLPYDENLIVRRQINNNFQTVSIPVIVLSAVGAICFKSDADHFYSLSKIAESEKMARVFYNKGRRYDAFTYISGGISIISVYTFIHSTFRKRIISLKMHKTFN